MTQSLEDLKKKANKIIADKISECDGGWSPRFEPVLDELDTLIEQVYHARTEEVKERCAVEVWNVLAQFTDCMEPTDRTNALSEAIKRIRKLDFATLTPKISNGN